MAEAAEELGIVEEPTDARRPPLARRRAAEGPSGRPSAEGEAATQRRVPGRCPAMSDERQLIVGLGNPGPRYARTRHNAGFLVVDAARRAGRRLVQGAQAAGATSWRPAWPACRSCWPSRVSYMNDSGGPVNAVAAVLQGPGRAASSSCTTSSTCRSATLRLKRGGGEGGHNGLRSTTAALGSKEYLRVRFGIGRPPGRQDPADYVLREFSAAERKELAFHVDRAADAVEVAASATAWRPPRTSTTTERRCQRRRRSAKQPGVAALRGRAAMLGL